MRKLTLKRKWSLIECGSRIFYYVQCAEQDATVEVKGVKCRELGQIKNGKSVETEIPTEQTTVYLVSSTMYADFTVPAGEEDVSLVAKPKYNPMQGNPFIISKA